MQYDKNEFNGYFNTIIWPMIALGQIIALRSRAKTSLKRITALLDADEDVKDGEVSFLPEIKGQIEFRHFSYKYSDGEEALHDISLTIEAGERVGEKSGVKGQGGGYGGLFCSIGKGRSASFCTYRNHAKRGIRTAGRTAQGYRQKYKRCKVRTDRASYRRCAYRDGRQGD